jgi:hypothetical protein
MLHHDQLLSCGVSLMSDEKRPLPRDNSPSPERETACRGLARMLSEPRSMLKLAIIGGLVLFIVGSFAYVAGWLSPGS